jgi:hypothetical protein
MPDGAGVQDDGDHAGGDGGFRVTAAKPLLNLNAKLKSSD